MQEGRHRCKRVAIDARESPSTQEGRHRRKRVAIDATWRCPGVPGPGDVRAYLVLEMSGRTWSWRCPGLRVPGDAQACLVSAVFVHGSSFGELWVCCCPRAGLVLKVSGRAWSWRCPGLRGPGDVRADLVLEMPGRAWPWGRPGVAGPTFVRRASWCLVTSGTWGALVLVRGACGSARSVYWGTDDAWGVCVGCPGLARLGELPQGPSFHLNILTTLKKKSFPGCPHIPH